ncbi:hypothetical protein HYPSUDRAFT_198987 [Hypholoma sublateritium FD-334 SS-4]|uniref:RecA family profile 1 domain-containing protein n=1 Tax=Hypholoma sublateritium (strain FD-334 SS-4) TaxID=945553 RepID=A0A0D2MQH3_HYPSF|nr:hypothetical protein HYPSUDRAFT_198987 [Hypholoma sublateritium FD-334 SS-4]
MRLSNLIPSIPANVVACLEVQGIRTDTDLLFSTTTFDIYKRLPAGTATLEELTEYTTIAAEIGAAPGMSGHELLLLENTYGDVQLRTGNAELDGLLRGLDGRWIIELSGDKGSGKSTVALNLLINHLASNLEDTALWIDTTCDFSPERATQFLDATQTLPSTLERLQVSLAFDIDTIQGILETLSRPNDPRARPRFLVIDTITPLLGPLLSAVSAQGHAIMTDFMRQLQTFAQASGTAVFVINNSSRKGRDTPERKPALGPSFALLTDTTLWLEAKNDNNTEDSTEDNTVHTMQILKSRSAPIGGCCTFRIHGNVICPT